MLVCVIYGNVPPINGHGLDSRPVGASGLP